jgi:hypothetical protein
MKIKTIISTIAFLFIAITSKSQIVLEQTYTNGEMHLANLTQSGYKYYTLDRINYKIILYNTNHSIFQTINLTPPPTGYEYILGYNSLSDNLFNADNLIEFVMTYRKTSSPYNTMGYVFDENNTVLLNIGRCIVPSIINVGGNYKLKTPRNPAQDTTLIYSLPGSLPCDPCGGPAGIIKNSNTSNTLPNAFPNPSSSQISIPYVFTNNETVGKICVYDVNGKMIKEFKVDNKFETLILDTQEFTAGTYYYNLTTDNGVSSAKKIIVIK